MTTVKVVGAAHTSAFPDPRRPTTVRTEHSTPLCRLVRRFPDHRYLCGVDGDLVTQVGELFEGSSFDPFGVASGVVVQAEVLVEGSGGLPCQMMTSMARSMATMALAGPRRLAMRQVFRSRGSCYTGPEGWRAPRCQERPSDAGSPFRVLVDFTRPADSLLPGQTPAQEVRCWGEAKRVRSPPVSAITRRRRCG